MIFIRLSLIVTALLFSCFSYAETSIWQVSNGKNTLYLGGTFHMLKPSDYPLPREFENVYKKVNWLVFETDMDQLSSPEFQQKFLASMTLPTGQILADHLSAEAYAELIRYAANNQMDTAQLQRFKPQMIALIITLEELKKYGLTAEGVDNYFGNKAKADSKMVTKLESIDDQIRYISTMGANNESGLILQTIEDMEELPEVLNAMTTAWRSGDDNGLFENGIKPMLEDYPKIYQSLLVERNNNWMGKIEKLLAHPEEKFILVGALHLIGQDGLLQQLKNRGYQVQQY
ncbi:MAG TPA: TraB/GumN family protein [Oceanospirillales bacterium]|nr:TraB/GumN family protein [Oceanospirillales bacterium]|tara:strand:- start:2764 stop:3627 length:864 start_codon:yes stop_codon:yes gene_type:complete